MKLENIIEEAAQMLGIDAPKKSTNWKILFRCANLALADVATNYYDCCEVQTFDVTTGIINFSEFDKKPVHKVKACNVPFELYSGFIGVQNGKITVKYAYIPEYTRQDEDISNKCAMMNESILLFGIMAQYASICGMTAEEKVFNRRFEEALYGITCVKKMRVMPCA